MSSSVAQILSSPYLVYSTSITSFIIARLLIHRVKKQGPISFADVVTKYNSIFYSLASFLLCLTIAYSIWIDISNILDLSPGSIICSPSHSNYDLTLRYIYHASKFYEYVDIFNVLASGGVVNAHFGFHHFTTPYLTYFRVLNNSTGWKVFAFLNTLHHAFMYAYFGGATIFSEILPMTGCLQLAVGILGELFVIWSGCAGEEALLANGLAVFLLGTYAVLFSGDLRERGKKGGEKEE